MKLLYALTVGAFCLLSQAIYAQSTVHSEDFNAGIGAWTSIDILDPTDVWNATAGYMEINGYGGANDEDWLISPSLNMDTQTEEYLMFDYNDFYDGGLIELYYSLDYTGGGTVADLQNATWTAIPLSVFDINATACFSTLFQRHPAIDVSGISGTSVHFAFKYTGTSTAAKRYRIDNFRIEADYYGSVQAQIALGVGCAALKTEIYNTIKTQSVIEYTSSQYDVWDAFLHTDRRLNDLGTATIVWDMFTDIPSGTGEYEFDHCGNRDNGSCPNGEGLCYNREHTLPRSWWGGGTSFPADTQNFDLHHLTPSDRLMNSAKLNYPPGEVVTATTIGSNGFKVGTNPAYPCPSMQYFEPIDEFKGDYARMFFFLATRYENQIASWASINTQGDCALDGTNYTVFEPWLLDLLLTWHANDAVSAKEIERNNAIYSIQGNRNPFIDNPSWVGYIWGDNLGNSCSSLVPGPCTPTSGSESVTACDSYTWTANSMTYTTSGAYTATLTNASGCDSVATLNLTINNSTSGSESVTACNSYTWTANSMTYTTSGTYTANLTTASGCDSVATLNLTINNSTSGSESVTTCNSYTWTANSMTYTTSGTYTANLTTASGCDSLATLNLTINNSTSGSESVTACNSYTWTANSMTYTTSGTYTANLTTASGCDSVATLNLTINNSTSGSESVTACGSYTWTANSMTYTTSGTYTATLTSTSGCDSVATLNLTINNSTSGSESVTACNSYTWTANSMTYTTSGTYTANLTTASGCDSVATLNLTINTIDTSVSQTDFTLTANQAGATYQWVDCNNNYAEIVGETFIDFTPSANGSYAVIVSANGCSDTSSCVIINTIGVHESTLSQAITIYPNPTSGKLFVDIPSRNEDVIIRISNALGQVIVNQTFHPEEELTFFIDSESGFYLLEIETQNGEMWKASFVKN